MQHNELHLFRVVGKGKISGIKCKISSSVRAYLVYPQEILVGMPGTYGTFALYEKLPEMSYFGWDIRHPHPFVHGIPVYNGY